MTLFFNLIKLLRIRQWLKNLMLYFPSFLGGELFSLGFNLKTIFPFVAFCAASSSTYIINDLKDTEHDRHHPDKCQRPLPSGAVSTSIASALLISFLTISIVLSYFVSYTFLLILVSYVIISIAYTLKLKEIPLVDIFSIAAGFLLRLLSGGNVFGVLISEWLFLSVFLLAIFLSAGKRLSEKHILGASAGHHRKSLEIYPEGFLEGTMYMTGAATLVTYTMYVISHRSHILLYTVPLCCFGLLRYILRIYLGKGGDPTESLTKDLPLFAVGFAWVCMVGWGIYGK